MNKLERDWIEDQESYRRMWRSCLLAWGFVAASIALGLLIPRDVAIVVLIPALVYYVRTVSEAKLQLRLRGRDDLVSRYLAWGWFGGFTMPIIWPVWRRLNPLPRPTDKS